MYLTRHGETYLNLKGLIQTFSDHRLAQLTSRGQLDSARKGRILKDAGIRHICTSPLGRAADTAYIIGGITGSRVEKLEELRDIHLGGWEGKSIDTVAKMYPEHYSSWRSGDWNVKPAGEPAESRWDLYDRLNKVLPDLLRDDVLVVTHLLPSQMIIGQMTGDYDLHVRNEDIFHLEGNSIEKVQEIYALFN